MVASSRVVPQFFMSAYVFDVICFCTHFPTMGWKWTTNDPTPIFLSYKQMWEQDFIPHFHQICHGVVLPLHQLVSTEDIRDSQKKLSQTSKQSEGIFLKSLSLISGYLVSKLFHMSSLCMSQINYWRGK